MPLPLHALDAEAGGGISFVDTSLGLAIVIALTENRDGEWFPPEKED
jgi:hypothetical protein